MPRAARRGSRAAPSRARPHRVRARSAWLTLGPPRVPWARPMTRSLWVDTRQPRAWRGAVDAPSERRWTALAFGVAGERRTQIRERVEQHAPVSRSAHVVADRTRQAGENERELDIRHVFFLPA